MNFVKTTLPAVTLALITTLFTVPVFAEVTVPKVVEMGQDTDPALQIAAQACIGLYNRRSGGSAYVRIEDKDRMWMDELGLSTGEVMDAGSFVDTCVKEFPRCVRYSYRDQQTLLPNILTVGAVLEAVPLDQGMAAQCNDVAFDAIKEFEDRHTPYLATKYVYENFVDDTTGLAMLNPGHAIRTKKDWDPPIVRDMDPRMIDFVFSEKLFVTYLVNGCIKGTKQHDLLNDIAGENPWPDPIGVYGYADYWLVFGGFLFESQTMCADSRNMGAIPTKTNNLSFFSTRSAPITGPDELEQNGPEDIEYDPGKTYVAFVVGDGDNISFIMDSRAEWFRRRVETCSKGEDFCPPLTWSISPHLPDIAPDVLEWYYEMAHKTGKDYFMLPPSGHLYSYPSSLEESVMQDRFVAATEADARLLGISSTVHWEWFTRWHYAEEEFLPKYAGQDGPIKGIVPVNVPYMFPTFTWDRNEFFKVLLGDDGGKTVLFRPREWRGVDDKAERLVDRKFHLSPESMAKELGGYPRGTVTAIYMTSDGGLNLDNSVMELIKILPEHVRLVSTDAAIKLALDSQETGGNK